MILSFIFFFNDTATTEIYTLSLHDALPIYLIERAADVVLKEGRKLVLSPREMPFNSIHLENMLKLSRMGAKIAPPVPAFYQRPKDIDEIVDFVTGKLLDSAGVMHNLFRRWE